ncbi:hypothetical protein [Candidatus Villigracilis proximus]|uniref:hypothetical protein n=1 Tax=Candidatus Villigracilis proximus TaxID=3140683 RepID=UPI0031EDCB42
MPKIGPRHSSLRASPEPREPEGWEESKVADFTPIQDMIRSIRNLRSEKGIAPSKKLTAQFSAGDKTDLLKDQAQMIAALLVWIPHF